MTTSTLQFKDMYSDKDETLCDILLDDTLCDILLDDIIQRNSELANNKQNQIKYIVNKKRFVLLKSDYLMPTSFYFDRTNNFIWQIETEGNGNAIFFKPSQDVFQHIAKLNDIKQNSYNIQRGILRCH